MRKKPSERVFPYYYKNGELHAFKLGGFGKDRETFFECMNNEIEFLKNSHRKINIWIDLHGTELAAPVMERLAEAAASVADQISLLALVGKINVLKKNRLRKYFFSRPEYRNTIIRFFTDPEEAKTWLVKGESWLKHMHR